MANGEPPPFETGGWRMIQQMWSDPLMQRPHTTFVALLKCGDFLLVIFGADDMIWLDSAGKERLLPIGPPNA